MDYIKELKEYMFSKGLTGKQMAALMQMDKGRFSQLLNGRKMSERVEWKVRNLLKNNKEIT